MVVIIGVVGVMGLRVVGRGSSDCDGVDGGGNSDGDGSCHHVDNCDRGWW